jgi:hypothetical protein
VHLFVVVSTVALPIAAFATNVIPFSGAKTVVVDCLHRMLVSVKFVITNRLSSTRDAQEHHQKVAHLLSQIEWWISRLVFVGQREIYWSENSLSQKREVKLPNNTIPSPHDQEDLFCAKGSGATK